MLQHCLPSVRLLVQHASAQGLTQPEKTSSWNISMILRPSHPLLPRKMVLGGLPWVAVLICLVPDAPFAVEEADAASSNPLPMAHQPTVDLLSLIGLRRLHENNAQVAGWLAENVSFAVALAIKPVAPHAAIFPVDECNQVLTAKSLPCLQCQGHCLMHQ